MFYGAKGNQ